MRPTSCQVQPACRIELTETGAVTLSMVLPLATFCDGDPGIQAIPSPFSAAATDALHAVLGLLDGRGNDSGTCTSSSSLAQVPAATLVDVTVPKSQSDATEKPEVNIPYRHLRKSFV